jgi:hypothetical protein
MHMHNPLLRTLALAAGVAALACSGWAIADPPSRVARVGYMTGPVSYSPAGESDWVQASINRPLTTGDRLWVESGARAEIQVGGAMVRLDAGTGVSVLNLDDRITQLQLTQGGLNVRVRRLEPNQVFEVDTPNLAFTLRRPGEFRIEVDGDGNATTIVVRRGQGEVYGESASYVIDSRQPYRFTGTGLREYEYLDVPRADEFDRWSSDRDRLYDSSVSARYVSQDVVGYQDLDAHGTWRANPTYGNVWYPSRVDAGWAPYRDGHWAWVDPWGWTWVDDAPWGFAVTHYGRWTNVSGNWGWIPGPVSSRAYYAPALVVFLGGDNFQLAISSGNVGGIGWFPLGPREVFRPSYAVSRGYFENVNRTNTVVNTTVINNYYNNTNVTNVVYANRQVPGAVIAVPTATFVQSQPVSRTAIRVTREMAVAAPVAVIAPVAPTVASVRGAAGPGGKPPARAFERPVVARTAPPAARAGFAAQEQQLTSNRGKPLDDAARRQLKPAAAAPAPVVRVVAETRKAPPTARLPATAASAKPGDDRGRADARKAPAAPVSSDASRAPSQAMPSSPAAQPPAQRGGGESRGKPEQRAQPMAPPSTPSAGAAQPAAVTPQADSRTPAVQTPRQRSAQPQAAPVPQAAPPAPAARQPARQARDEPAASAKQGEPRPATAAPKSVPPPPQSRQASKGQAGDDGKGKPAAGEPDDRKKSRDEQARERENRTQ